jgi:hypothetical protein
MESSFDEGGWAILLVTKQLMMKNKRSIFFKAIPVMLLSENIPDFLLIYTIQK